jgi:DNA-binding MarR family transcriptional regulator
MTEITIGSRHLAAMTTYGKNAISGALRDLEADGWIERYIGQDAPGRYQADTYSVVPHAEWADKHPGACEALANHDKSVLIASNRSKCPLYLKQVRACT